MQTLDTEIFLSGYHQHVHIPMSDLPALKSSPNSKSTHAQGPADKEGNREATLGDHLHHPTYRGWG